VSSPYATQAPSVQQTLDLFRGKWASSMPKAIPGARAGTTGLFEDARVDWAARNLSALGFEMPQSAVLEVGPLEGGHTYCLSRVGARHVTAVEAHPEAFMKCLVMKEVLGIERVNFLYGDAVAYLRSVETLHDIGFASGFLYHMANPVEFLELLCSRTRAVYLWTVYWDAEFSRRNPGILAGTAGVAKGAHAGFQHTLHLHDYGSGFNYGTFWGGPDSYSNWMEKDEILGALSHFGFSRQIVELESNPNGSAMQLVATRP